MSAAIGIGTRVINPDGAAGKIVGRVDKHFLEVQYDQPQTRKNYAGVEYMTSCELVHVETMMPEDGLF